jgi:hypothetical protein
VTRSVLALAGALLCLLLPSAAQADYETLGSGQTKIFLDKGFLQALSRNGVGLVPVAPAKLNGGVLTFPVSDGKFDPTSGEGEVEHEGALIFKAGGRRIPLKSLRLKTTQRHAPLSAKLGGSQLKIGSVATIGITHAGFASGITAHRLTLSPKVAGRLEKKLRLRGAFEDRQTVGYVRTTVAPSEVVIRDGGVASLAFDPSFLSKLDSLHVAVNPISPAEHPEDFTFPISGGRLAPDVSSGRLEFNGSIEFLQLGGGQIFWAGLTLDPGAAEAVAEVNVQPSPPYPGKVGKVRIAAFSVGSARVSSIPKAATIEVEGATLTLSAETATYFNEAFAQGRPVFTGQEPCGAISFTATAQ